MRPPSVPRSGCVLDVDRVAIAHQIAKEVGEALAAAYPDIVEVVEKKTTRKSSTQEE